MKLIWMAIERGIICPLLFLFAFTIACLCWLVRVLWDGKVKVANEGWRWFVCDMTSLLKQPLSKSFEL